MEGQEQKQKSPILIGEATVEEGTPDLKTGSAKGSRFGPALELARNLQPGQSVRVVVPEGQDSNKVIASLRTAAIRIIGKEYGLTFRTRADGHVAIFKD